MIVSPLASAGPWNPLLENGYPNPQIPRFLEALPLYGLSSAGFTTWEAQAVWLFVLYFVGSLLAIRAGIALFPELRERWWTLIVIGVGYQLMPSLMFNLQDSAAFGLPIATYWGFPLLAIALLDGPRWNRIAGPALVGVASLLVLAEFPATLVPLLIFSIFLIIVLLLRNPGWDGVRRLAPFALVSFLWSLIANLWWLVPEYEYRSALLSNLAVNTPLTASYPDHLAGLVFLNWAWPSPATFLTYMAGWPYMLASLSILILTLCAAFRVRATRGGLAIFTFWLVTLLLVYGSSDPFQNAYQQLFAVSVLSYLIRNSSHFSPIYDLLTILLFAIGTVWLSEEFAPAALRFVRNRPRSDSPTPAPRSSPRPFGPRTRPGTVTRWAVVGVACGLLVVAGLPLVDGDAVENVTFNGTEIAPVLPIEHGVHVPGYYDQARTWLSDHEPDSTTLVVPMPDTWLSAGSNLSWGYEGTSAIYSTLLAEPLITNDVGTLTAPSFPAISGTYSIAAAGGPPGPANPLKLNNTTYIWPGYSNDSVALSPAGGPGGSPVLNWSVYLGQDYGVNGHQLQWDIDANLPANSTYFGLWVRPLTPGVLWLSWGVKQTLEGWYPVSTTPGVWNHVVLPMSTPPPINYDPASLAVTDFPNATSFTFQFQPSGTLSQASGEIQLANFSVYAAEPAGLAYYVRSLGARVIVVDRSIVSTPSDPLQNLSSYRALLGTISPWLAATFGNLSIYVVPDPLPLVGTTPPIGATSNYYLAWDNRSVASPYFALDPPSWLDTNLTPALVQVTSSSPSNYNVAVQATGPFVLVLLQNFDPLWVAEFDGEPIGSHFEIDGFANAWLVNRSGTFSLTVTFEPVQTFTYLLIASPIAAAALAVISLPAVRSRLPKWGPGTTRADPKSGSQPTPASETAESLRADTP